MKFSMSNEDQCYAIQEDVACLTIKREDEEDIILQIDINDNIISLYLDTEYEISTQSTAGDVDLIVENPGSDVEVEED